MVVVQGKGAVGEPLEKAVEKDQRLASRTSNATNKWSELDPQPHRLASLNDAAGRTGSRKEESGILDEFKEKSQTIGHYANIASDNNVRTMSEQPRQMFELHRRSRKDSIDSIDEPFLPQIQRIFQSEYECMSSPESFSTSSSNRSSNTSSLHSNYTPDSVSLASFAGRINFGKWEGGKRCSQASTASQESGHRSWGKTRDSLEFSDGSNKYFARRNSSDHTYENTSILTQETLKKWNNHANDMEDIPPPLPVRQCPPSSGNSKTPKVELIMPYKVVDLEELQKSLDCDEIDPYYIHDGSMSPENDTYTSPYVDLPVEPELTIILAQNRDDRPALPPKRRSLSHSLSDTSFGSGGKGTKEQPTTLSRQSMAFNDTALSTSSPRQASGQDQTSTDEESSPLDGPTTVRGRLARQQSLPVGRVSRSRRNSTSPQKITRPRRTAPPPPSQSMSPSNKGPLARPVSEIYPRPRRPNSCSPKPLKRSNTAGVLQSPFNQIQVEAVNEKLLDSRSCGQDESVAMSNSVSSSKTAQTGLIENEKPAQDSVKSFFAKSNVFKKALISLKIPGTKKQAKKELIVSTPTDFASLNKSRPTADSDYRGRKCVSFVDDDKRDEKETAHPDSMTVKVDAKAENVGEADEQFYHNFPISHAIDNPENQQPKKPPRTFPTSSFKDTVCHDGYLEPCTSQRTKDREDEINENKLPALGPLPSPPAESTSPVRDAVTARQDINEDCKARKPATKAKPALPRRPQSLQLKRKSMQLNEKFKDGGQNLALATEVATQKTQPEPAKSNAYHDDTTLGKTERRSRSCEIINVDDTPDSYVTDMHVTVLKDILLCWRKLLRKPAISLAGACWEDFEIVELDSWPKVCDSQGSVLQPVRLKKSFRNVGSLNCSGKFMAKIKSQTRPGNATKSFFDQDYSVCTSVASHENIASVLAYFRGDIRSPLLDQQNGISQVHTTISISEQVPSVTCEEFVAKSVESRGTDPYSYERTACLLVLQCLRGLNHLHECGFTHGNLTLSNMFLIKKANDFQLFLGNFGRSQPLPKERRGSGLNHRIAGDVLRPEPRKSQNRRSLENGTESIQKPEPKMLRNDVVASADVISAMLHSGLNCNDQNGNLVDVSKARSCSAMFGFLEKASARLRDGTATLRQTVGLLQALLWGPFKSGENMCILSEGRTKQWLERQRGEFIARLAMDEALSRTANGEERPKFSMEDFLFCEYLSGCNPNSLIRSAKCWFFETKEKL